MGRQRSPEDGPLVARFIRGEVAMPKTSRAAAKHSCEPARRMARVWVAAIATLYTLSVKAVSAKSLPVDQRGATMMSFRRLIEHSEKFDRKFVWVVGALSFRNGTAFLCEESAGKDDSKENVCVAPIESVTDPSGSGSMKTLRRFDGVSPVSLHGRYERSTSADCPNGTVFVAILEVSLE